MEAKTLSPKRQKANIQNEKWIRGKVKTKVLVADDDSLVLDIISFALEETGKYEVLHAPDGEEALATFVSDPQICIVISDVNMPKMGGLELLKAIRAQDSKIPFLVMSGNVDKAVAVSALALGATSFMSKDKGFFESIAIWVNRWAPENGEMASPH